MRKCLTSLFTANEWQQLMLSLKLTHRKSQILNAILNGDSDKQIAKKLGIAAPTVRSHLTHLFEQFQVNDRTQLVIEIFKLFRRHGKCSN
jgi:DNA-binding NarL/FixJ family response regulator